MDSDVSIEWYADDRHARREQVPDHGHKGQRRCRVDLVRVDDVQVGADEDAYRAVAEER